MRIVDVSSSVHDARSLGQLRHFPSAPCNGCGHADHFGSRADGAKLPASKSASRKKQTHTRRPPKYLPSSSMYAFMATACFENLTKILTR
mmetsp:Transcript_20301/g.61833  ORF Transcript_20301/g.61833 Transcript_20301/m.61833 type:complete len:90 (-) Transcript_20301:932-1201(-)